MSVAMVTRVCELVSVHFRSKWYSGGKNIPKQASFSSAISQGENTLNFDETMKHDQ